MSGKTKNSLLLHICCAGCGVYVSRELQSEFDVSLFFFNPNIFPDNERILRAEEAGKVASANGLPYLVQGGSYAGWLDKIKGFEKEPEKGKRCRICYECRIDMTARKAKESGYSYFGTTLTVSPHKDAAIINEIGERLALKYGLKYLNRDFKKKEGFKKAACLSKELGLYRQNYCGCAFSARKIQFL